MRNCTTARPGSREEEYMRKWRIERVVKPMKGMIPCRNVFPDKEHRKYRTIILMKVREDSMLTDGTRTSHIRTNRR